MRKLKSLLTGLGFLASFDGHSQVDSADTLSLKNIEFQYDSTKDFMRSWIHFDLTDTIDLMVIHHIPASMDCTGGINTFSITIGTTRSGDTIRVLESCNRANDVKMGDVVAVIPANELAEYHTHPGVFVQGYQGQLRPGLYDTKILKTTCGVLRSK